MSRKGALIIILTITTLGLKAQTKSMQNDYPEVGKAMPDFGLKNIEYFPKKEVTLSDFRGKWLILDFWNKGCGACVKSFPKVNQQMKEFKDKVQFMMVGYQDKENEIRPMYAKLKKKLNLSMPCAFDSIFCQRFDIFTAPHIVIIDDKGIVRGITNQLKQSDIAVFLEGRTPILAPTYRFMSDTTNNDRRLGRFSYNDKYPLLINNNGGADTDFLFRSVLTRWNPFKSVRVSAPDRNDWKDLIDKNGKVELLGVSLLNLYNIAYFGTINPGGYLKDTAYYGKYFSRPIMETQDSVIISSSEYATGKNYYSYSLIISGKDAENGRIQHHMQRDIEDYFGYEGSLETRLCPYLKLVATDKAKINLRTKGAPYSSQGDYFSWVAKNIPIQFLLDAVVRIFPFDKAPIILDETGIDANIDITMNCFFKDFNEVKRELIKNGLELIPAMKPMKVLVIRDSK